VCGIHYVKPVRVPFVLLFFTVSLFGCTDSADTSGPRPGRDVAVQWSPDKATAATVREVSIDGSVMVSQWYQLILKGTFSGQTTTQVVLAADHTEGLRAVWRSPTLLSVCYGAGTAIRTFTNSLVLVDPSRTAVRSIEVMLDRRERLAECPVS
jgi:hypothetical protein